MLKPKAPRDMTATEFVEHYISKHLTDQREFLMREYFCEELESTLSEPAPNPFTPDQIAWMREEQREGFLFAYKRKNGSVFCGTCRPEESCGDIHCSGNAHSAANNGFLDKALGELEFIRFADYAPLDKEDL